MKIVQLLGQLRRQQKREMHIGERDICPEVKIVTVENAIGNVVVFGGLRPTGGYVVPAFEFVRTFSQLSYNVIFVRDLTQRWFNFGIAGFSRDMEDTANQIRKLLRTNLPPNLPLYTVGNSAGGYASIFFGDRLRVEVALAICPQTIIDRKILARFGHKGWEQMDRFEPWVPDLRPALKGGAKVTHIVAGYLEPPDVVHAGNLAGLANTKIELVKAKHDVGRVWQDLEGGLAAQISQRLQGQSPNQLP